MPMWQHRKSFRHASRLPLCALAALYAFILTTDAIAGPPGAIRQTRHGGRNADALLISDIHFDPFQDPEKTRRLDQEPISQWNRILAGAPSANQEPSFAEVRDRCGRKVFDTSAALFLSTAAAVRQHRHDVSFGVLTGDLVAHDFFCRYDVVFPGRTKQDAAKFVIKTSRYVVEQIGAALAPKPVYVVLGNNDSDCGDYRIDRNDAMFRDLRRSIAAAARIRESRDFTTSFDSGGNYVSLLPAPMRKVSIVVLDDVPFSAKAATCAGTSTSQETADDLKWLQARLDTASQNHQKVLLASHIPPGIDSRNTLFVKNMCEVRKPTMFLNSDALADLLVANRAVIGVGLFGHTHMDEFRILEPQVGAAPLDTALHGIPIKIIPSVSPVSGNIPSFTMATFDTQTAELMDFTVYAKPQSADGALAWIPQYSFSTSYMLPSFSGPALERLIGELQMDVGGESTLAKEYIERYSPGMTDYAISTVWPAYRCALNNFTASSFLSCACPPAQLPQKGEH
jgi:sphingomyelin phosphodiesterase acid-like 3